MDQRLDNNGNLQGHGNAGAHPGAGWYYAQGDPIGTTRYWDGTQWTGGPVPQAQPVQQTTAPQPTTPQPFAAQTSAGYDNSYGVTYGATDQSQNGTGQTGSSYRFPGAPARHNPYAAGHQVDAVVELSPIGYWKKAWADGTKFEGRARRAEYWYFALINFGIGIILQILAALDGIGPIFAIGYLIFLLASFLPSLAVASRRMHDTNHSAWWYLVPFVNLVFLCTDGDRWTNPRGPSPKYRTTPTPAPLDSMATY